MTNDLNPSQARGVGQDGAGFDDVQAEEGDRPHAVENLQE